MIAGGPLGPAYIDITVLDGLRSLQREGFPDLVAKILTTYLTETSKTLVTLSKAVQDRNAQEIQFVAHNSNRAAPAWGHSVSLPSSDNLKPWEGKAKIDTVPEVISEIMAEYEGVRCTLEIELAGRGDCVIAEPSRPVTQ